MMLQEMLRMPRLNDITAVSIDHTVDEISRGPAPRARYAGHLHRRLLMDKRIQHALAHDRTIDITTRGRKTGQLHRTELWFYYIDGHVYITGAPGRRDWYANLLAHPEFTFHLKQSTKADLPARATPILARARRRAIIASIDQTLGGSRDLDAWVAGGPLVAVELLVE
jgi:deazaflavin-dependent oxidoreductase (nitroreductase family)